MRGPGLSRPEEVPQLKALWKQAFGDTDRTIDAFEQSTITGEGATWEEAQAACPVPEDAQVLSWSRWPI